MTKNDHCLFICLQCITQKLYPGPTIQSRLWPSLSKMLGEWTGDCMDTPETVMTTKAPALLINNRIGLCDRKQVYGCRLEIHQKIYMTQFSDVRILQTANA